MSWKRSKGMSDNTCSKCNGGFKDEEFNDSEDLCDYCLFPEASRSRPSEVKYYYGDGLNITNERELLDNLDYIPEKQSKASVKSKQKFLFKQYKNR